MSMTVDVTPSEHGSSAAAAGNQRPAHTPTPWRMEDHGVYNAYRTWKIDGGPHFMRVVGSFQHSSMRMTVEGRANAKFILACVNSHDGLVACREALRLLLNGRDAATGTGAGYLSSSDWAIARDALALVDSAPGGSSTSDVSECVTSDTEA